VSCQIPAQAVWTDGFQLLHMLLLILCYQSRGSLCVTFSLFARAFFSYPMEVNQCRVFQ
jgi:hypothetical protein